jgi:hypothetical protein
MGRIRRSISSAHVIAIIALMVALGGTGYAALRIPRNSVGTSQLKKNAVISSRVKNRSLRAIDFKNGQLPRGPQGAQGPRGVTGAQGAPGADGPMGPAGSNGTNGTNGTDGTDGTNGSDGTNGADGATGPTGRTGADGATGPTGRTGVDGQKGPTGAAGVDGTAVAFARIDETGALIGGPDENKGVVQPNIQHDMGAGAAESTGDGVYCIGGLGFTPSSAIVTLDNTDSLPAPTTQAGGSLNFIASVAVFKGEDFGRCDAAHGQVRVALEQVSNAGPPTLANHGFIIWFQ